MDVTDQSNIDDMLIEIDGTDNKNNLGAGFSRNEAIKIAKGKYLAFCDADDLWEINKLENQLIFMKKNNVNFSHTSYNIINDLGSIIGNRRAYKEIKFKELLRSCDIGLSTVVVEKKIISLELAVLLQFKN